MEAAYNVLEFPARFFNGFHMFRFQRRKGNHMRVMPALSEESHPAQGVNISSVGKKTNSHLESAHGPPRLSFAQTQRFNRHRGAAQESLQRRLHSCAYFARSNLSDGQFQFDFRQAAGHPRSERAYLRVAFERQSQATQFLFSNFNPVPRP